MTRNIIKNVEFPSIRSRNLFDPDDSIRDNLARLPNLLPTHSIPYDKVAQRVVSVTTGTDAGATAYTFPGAVDDAGDFNDSGNLLADDGANATKPTTPVLGDCTVDTFGFAIPSGATITKLTVRIEWRVTANTGTARASWTKDGGSNFTTILSSSNTTGETTTLGDGALSTWGGTFDITPAQANDDDNFQVKLYASSDSAQNEVDFVAVQITYEGSGETSSAGVYNMATMPVDATAGSVMFAATGSDPYLEEDNANLFWDDTNNRLGIGTSSPSVTLDVRGAAIFNEAGADADFRIEGNTRVNLFFLDASADFIGIGNASPATTLDIDSNSNTQCLRIRGADGTNEIGDLYMAASGEFNIDLRSGNDNDQHLEIRTEDDQFGVIIRTSDGSSATTPYANLYLTDASDDYLTINITSVKDVDALVIAASNTVGVGVIPTKGKLEVAGNLAIGGSNNELRFYEGANYVGFEAPALSADQIWVLPTVDGNARELLQTDNSGNLSWSHPIASDITIADSNSYYVTDTVEAALDEAGQDLDFFNGTFHEFFNALVTSNGTTVTLTVTNAGGGDLIARFSSGNSTFTGGSTIALTAGSDDDPEENFIYILQSAPTTLVKSTSAFPGTEHIKIGYFLVPSAGFVQTNGVYVNQNWNDEVDDTTSQGHMSHLTERSRRLGSQYFSGIDENGSQGYLTPTANNVELKSTAGVVYQMHTHTVSAFDTTGGDLVLVKNWSGDAYHDITNLFDITKDSGNNTIGTNKWFNLVVWGAANKSGELSPMFINLPSSFYNKQSDAQNDVSGYDDFSIPREFNLESSVAFLIARITIKMGTTWSNITTVDLRGLAPTTAKGGAAGVVTSFADNAFEIFDESDVTKIVTFDVGTSVSTTRTLIIPDINGTIMLNVVEDTTPQLGGDLDLNSKNIDFPTTANVSDCLDEDDMSSDSATVLATQQSIKAYVDAVEFTDEAIKWAILL